MKKISLNLTFPRSRQLRGISAAVALLTAAALPCGSARAQVSARSGSTRVVVAIKSDGSCAITNDYVQPRKLLEMQATSWERMNSMDLGSGADNKPPEPKSLTNEELSAKLREMYRERPDFTEDSSLRIEDVPDSTNMVRVVTVATLASPKDLLSRSLYSWAPNFPMFENARLEIDTNSQLRLTFTPSKEAARYAKSLERSWRSTKSTMEWKLVLPGKVLSTGFPGKDENSTWIAVDAEKSETIDAAAKLATSTVVITAEPAGLKIDEPLESKKLARNPYARRNAQPDLPITDAGPGFAAEAVALTVTTVHQFPGAEKFLKDTLPGRYGFGGGQAGTVVSAKLFPPKGREIRSVTGIRVKAAKDDTGKAVPGAPGSEDNTSQYEQIISVNADDSEQARAARVTLQLGLPAPEAKAIDEMDCEAVALTIGGWKELVLTNVQADAKKEIDLTEVLPGATLVIKRISGGGSHKTVDATFAGPAAVQQLELKVKSQTRNRGQSSMMERRSTTKGDKTLREISLQSYSFSMEEAPSQAPLVLIVRFPQDLKRERVQFKLTGLDLL